MVMAKSVSFDTSFNFSANAASKTKKPRKSTPTVQDVG